MFICWKRVIGFVYCFFFCRWGIFIYFVVIIEFFNLFCRKNNVIDFVGMNNIDEDDEYEMINVEILK